MRKQYYLLIFIFVSLLPILILRDYTPNNELKYLSIAQESINNGNIFAFYNHGEPYADKPPLYIWIVILGKLIFGKHVMFFLSLFSLVPAFITVLLMNKWIREEGYKDELASIMLLTSGFFLACSFVLRMDMLMTMFITFSIYSFYKMYKYNTESLALINYKKWSFLLPIFTFLAIFTKGAVGIMVPLLTISVFLGVNNKIKTIGKYIGWKFWGILAIFCTFWFLGVYLDGGKEYLNNLLFNQTINRAVDSFHHKEPFYYYAITYWYAIAPWSIVVFIAILTGLCKKLITTNLEKLFLIASLGTIIMMSFISSKIVIYLLPAFPFLVYLGAILMQKIGANLWIKVGVAIPAIICILAFPATFIIEKMNILPPINLWAPIPVFTLILSLGGCISLFYIFKNNISRSVMAMGLSLFVLLFTAGLSMNNINNIIGLKNAANYAKEMCFNIKEENGVEPSICIYDFKIGENLDVYFNQKIKVIQEDDLSMINNSILFVKNRTIKKDRILNSITEKNVKLEFGEYSVIVIK